MSQINPYSVTQAPNQAPIGQKISIDPFSLISRGWGFIKPDYWLFLGLCLVAVFLGSMVPFGIILGPMFVGYWLCHMELATTKRTSFETLFRGFDSFMPAFLACIIQMAFMMFVVVGMFAILILGMVATAGLASAGGGEPDPGLMLIGFVLIFLFMTPAMLLLAVMQYAMMLSFFLIADRGLDAWQSVTVAYRAILRNFWGVLWMSIVFMFVTLALMCLCYFPALLFMPVMYAALFMLFRDLFPKSQPIAASPS